MTVSLESPRSQEPIANSPKSSGRLIYADILRALAIVQVVYVHSVAPFMPSLAQKSGWWACLIPEVLGRASVPLFIMLSGLFLFQTEEVSLSRFLRKLFNRILLPLVVWSGIYLLWSQYMTGTAVTGYRCLQLLQIPAYYHLGFMYFLTGLYLAAPILRPFVRSATKSDYVYFAALWLINASVPLFCKLTGVWMELYFVVFTNLTAYFIVGYGLRNVSVPKQNRLLLWLMLVTSCVVSGIGTYLLTAQNKNQFDPLLIESASPTIFVYSVATFVLVKSLNWESLKAKHPTLVQFFSATGGMAYSIYLLHPIVLDLCLKLHWNKIFTRTGFGWTSLKTFIVFVVAFSLTWLCVRIAKLLKAPSWIFP